MRKTDAAYDIVRQLETASTPTRCALGQGLQQAQLQRDARTIELFCSAIGLDIEAAREALSPRASAASYQCEEETADA